MMLMGEVLAPGDWTPDQAAAYVTEAWQNAVESIVETGRRLTEAKKRVGHGNWIATVRLLPFGISTADKLMQIGRHPDLSNSEHVPNLPAAWGTLAILSQLPPGEIPRRIEAREITAELDRATAQQWVSTYAVARQETLSAYGQFSDAVVAALSYAKTYKPPADTDIYPSQPEVLARIEELAEIARAWKENID